MVGLEDIVQRDDVCVVKVIQDFDFLKNLLAEQAFAATAVLSSFDDKLGSVFISSLFLFATAYYCELTARETRNRVEHSDADLVVEEIDYAYLPRSS